MYCRVLLHSAASDTMFFTFLEWQLLCCTILNKPAPCMFVVEHQCHHAQLHSFLIFVLLHAWDRNRLQSHIFLIVRLLSRIRWRKILHKGLQFIALFVFSDKTSSTAVSGQRSCQFYTNVELGEKICLLYIYMFSDILLHDIDDNHDDNDQSFWTQPLLVDPTDWENVWPPD